MKSKMLGIVIALMFVIAATGCGAGPMQGPVVTTPAPAPAPPPPPPPPPPTISSVNHIVILMQENRSFDSYFAKLNDYRAAHGLGSNDVDLLSMSVALPTWDGSPAVSPFHMNSMCSLNMSSSWAEAHVDRNYQDANNPGDPPPMNGFVYVAGGFCDHSGGAAAGCWDVAGARAMGYYTDADLPFYYWAATQFATSDRWFSPAPSRTQINRVYLLAATSEGHAYPPDTDVNTDPWNLKAKTIFQLLQENNITWKVYVKSGMDTHPPTGNTYMNYYTQFTPQHTANFVPYSQYATDAANGTLPQVSLIESGYDPDETGGVPTDEHPNNNVQIGAKFVHDTVTTLINSPSWKDSVLFLTYDEGGGLYDHVPPIPEVNPDGIPPQDLPATDPTGDFTISGFRVPLIIFSPFAKKGYVSHTPADFTAMLKFIETRFNLPSLNNRDKAQPDMQEFFDWTAPNLNPGTIVDQPTTGPCYSDHLP